MSRESVDFVMNLIVRDFKDMLTEAVLDESNSFPYTCACIQFLNELNGKGIMVDFNLFDSSIIDNVYRELIFFLSH